MYVLDTNVLSEIRRTNADPAVVRWVDSHDEELLFITAVTVYELRRGILDIPAADRATRALFDGWFETVMARFEGRVLSLDATAAIGAAEANRRTNVDLKDCMVGAIANRHDMPVVTRNVRHLGRVASRVINPWDAAS